MHSPDSGADLREQQECLEGILMSDEGVMRDLRHVRSLRLPQGCIAAGYIRGLVWDHLHGYGVRTRTDDVEDAMARWPETATAVAARLNERDKLEIVAPYGLHDLVGMVVRQSPLFNDEALFLQRVCGKNWLKRWPKLILVSPSAD